MKRLLVFFLLAAVFSLHAEVSRVFVFPADWQGKSYHFIEGYPAGLVLSFGCDRGPIPSLLLELPDFLELKAVTTRIGWPKTFPFRQESFLENGRAMVRYRVDFSAEARPHLTGWRNGFHCFIEPVKGNAGKDASFRIAFLENGKRTFEQVYRASLLPEPAMPAEPLRYFKTGITTIRSAALADDALLKEASGFWHKLDPRPFFSVGWSYESFPAECKAFLDENFTLITGVAACRHSTVMFPATNFEDLGFLVQGTVTRPGVPPFIGSDGKPVRGAICPEYLIADPEGLYWGEYFKRGFEAYLKNFPRCRDLWLDFEPFVTEGVCDNCLKKFAVFAKLEEVPKREDIRNGQPLNRKWREFKAGQFRTILEKFVDAAERHFPGFRIHLCTETPSPDYLSTWNVVDSSTVASRVYAFDPMNYTTGLAYFDSVAADKKVLGNTLDFSWVDPAEENERFFNRYKPETILQNIVAAASLGIGGIVFYPSDSLDGRMLDSIAAGFRAVKEVEEILANGTDAASRLTVTPRNGLSLQLPNELGELVTLMIPDFSKDLRTVLKEKDGVYAASILNYSGREVFLQLAIADFPGDGETVVIDTVSGTRYEGITAENVRNGFLVRIPEDGVLLLRIGGGAGENTASLSPETLENTLQTALKTLQGGDSFLEPLEQGEASLRRVIRNKSPMIRLGMGNQNVIIDPSGATVTQWKQEKYTPLGGPRTSLGEVCFNSPENRKKQEYQITGFEANDDSAQVTLSHTVPRDTGFGEEDPLADLQIVKRITLKNGGPGAGSLEFLVTFRDTGTRPQSFNFRFRNIPFSEWKAVEPVPATFLDGVALEPSRFYGRTDGRISWHAAARILPHDGPMTAEVRAPWYTYTFLAPGCAAFYSWNDGILATVEEVFEDVSLAPGEEKSFTQIVRFRRKE